MINRVNYNPQVFAPRFTGTAETTNVQNIPAVSNPQQANKPQSENLITNYLNNLANQNKVQVAPKPEFTPSGVGEFENMTVKNTAGEIVQSVKYAQEGDKITQNIDVKCNDGSTFNKVVTKDGNKKAMTLEFKDKDGNILTTENRTYEQIDEDTAISVHNGEEYKITGLKGSVITIEHNGKKQVIDLEKKLASHTEDVRQNKNGQATPEQKEFLISMIKKQPADIILRVDKETDNLVFLDCPEYEGYYNENGRALKASQKADSGLIIHELGHAIYDVDNGKGWGDNNQDYINTRAVEIENLQKSNAHQKIKDMMRKFTTQNYPGQDPKEGLIMGANEEFAETFNIMNNIDIDNVWYKSTAIIQYMPKSALMALEGAKSLEPKISSSDKNLAPERNYIPNPEGVKVSGPDMTAANQALAQADLAEKYINETMKSI